MRKPVNFTNRQGARINMRRIATLFNSGHTVSEISDKMGFTDTKSDWPYSYTYGLLAKLRRDGCLKGRR